jgi:hypothetical protein
MGGQPKGGYKRWRPLGQKKYPKLPIDRPTEPPVEGGIHLASLTEGLIIAAAPFTDTAIQKPAGAMILSVAVGVKIEIPTATTFTVGDPGDAARFSTAPVSTAVSSSDPGTAAGAYYNATAESIRITPDLTPADNSGYVRVTINYFTST